MQQTAVKLYNAYSYAFFTNENQALGEAVSRPITVYIIIDTINIIYKGNFFSHIDIAV